VLGALLAEDHVAEIYERRFHLEQCFFAGAQEGDLDDTLL